MAKKKSTHGDYTLDEARAIVEKKFGKGKSIWATDFGDSEIQRVPSGSFALDVSLGGGLAVGYNHNYWGDKSSGKTTNAFRSTASFQHHMPNKKVLWIAAEPWDQKNALANGVDPDKLILVFPEYGEQAIDMATIYLATGQISLMVVDSVDMLIPKAELEGSMEEGQRSVQPRMLNRALRKLGAVMQPVTDDRGITRYSDGLTCIWISQMRLNQGVMWGNPETAGGGKGFGHAQSVQIQFQPQSPSKTIWNETLFADKYPCGLNMNSKTTKNKTYAPFRVASYDYYYARHEIVKFGEKRMFLHGMIDHSKEVIDLAIFYRVIKESGNKLEWRGESYPRHRLEYYFDHHPKAMLKCMRKTIRKVEPEIPQYIADYYVHLLASYKRKIHEWKERQKKRNANTTSKRSGKVVRVGQKRKSSKTASRHKKKKHNRV